jgi:hypothetical protein
MFSQQTFINPVWDTTENGPLLPLLAQSQGLAVARQSGNTTSLDTVSLKRNAVPVYYYHVHRKVRKKDYENFCISVI